MKIVIHPRLILTVAGAVTLFILFSLAQEMNRRWQVQGEVEELHNEVRTMQKRVIELEHLNEYFRTDDYQERLAREKLNYHASGEKVVLIPEEESANEVGNAVPVSIEKLSLPLKWWKVFFVDKTPNWQREGQGSPVVTPSSEL